MHEKRRRGEEETLLLLQLPLDDTAASTLPQRLASSLYQHMICFLRYSGTSGLSTDFPSPDLNSYTNNASRSLLYQLRPPHFRSAFLTQDFWDIFA